jgi:deoxyadenosine/deoxycytidine kinase
MKVIYVEGNIGSGKSSLAYSLWHHLQKKHSETVCWTPESYGYPWDNVYTHNKNNIWLMKVPEACYWENFYAHPTDIFPFQVMILSNQLRRFQEIVSHNPEIIVMERSLDACGQVFAKALFDLGKISESDWEQYQKLLEQYKAIMANLIDGTPHESTTIHVKSDPHTFQKSVTTPIDLAYLTQIEKNYEAMMAEKSAVIEIENNTEGLGYDAILPFPKVLDAFGIESKTEPKEEAHQQVQQEEHPKRFKKFWRNFWKFFHRF